MPRRPGLTPDQYLEISLNGTSIRLQREDVPGDEAVAQLRELAAGRSDLLAEAAGTHIGGWLARPGTTDPARMLSAAWLLLAGADPNLALEHAEVVRLRASKPMHSAPPPKDR